MEPMDFAALPMFPKKEIRILFVCMGNICRSPALEGALRHLVSQKNLGEKIFVESCGLGWFHLGEPPDKRAFEAAKKRGILLDHRAEQFQESYLDEFDFIFAVDHDILEQILFHAKTEKIRSKVKLATEFSQKYPQKPIPDPYYMSPNGFEEMMDMVEDSALGIFREIEKSHLV